MSLTRTDDFWKEKFDLLAERNYVVIDGFLSEEESSSLRDISIDLRAKEAFRLAGIGTDTAFQRNTDIRTDRIHWIDKNFEEPKVIAFLERMDEFRRIVNRECFLSLSGQEFHFAHYPPGSFYKRHLDQFDHRDNRLISVICYLNDKWQKSDGGTLKIYGENEAEIEPLAGRLVLMRSDIIEHEVNLSHNDRYSLTGWLTHQPPGLGFLS